jgi:hypothetical protein
MRVAVMLEASRSEFAITRVRMGRPSQSHVPDGEGMAELHWSLRLLQSIDLHLSLYRFDFRIDASVAASVLDGAFGLSGLIGRLADSHFALLLLGTDPDISTAETMVRTAVGRPLEEYGLPASTFALAALHGFGQDMGDPDDLIVRLANLPAAAPGLERAA